MGVSKMDFNDLEFIRKRMQVLIGAKWIIAGRISGMAWFGFVIDNFDFALHVQSGFRIRMNNKIIIANLDMYEPTIEVQKKPDFDWDTYNWEVKGNNCYDIWIQEFRKSNRNGVVKNIRISNLGDLTIEIDNGMVIEVFINTSFSECWRFFERSSDDHLIINGKGLEKDG